VKDGHTSDAESAGEFGVEGHVGGSWVVFRDSRGRGTREREREKEKGI
jgi:hypothetical protein